MFPIESKFDFIMKFIQIYIIRNNLLLPKSQIMLKDWIFFPTLHKSVITVCIMDIQVSQVVTIWITHLYFRNPLRGYPTGGDALSPGFRFAPSWGSTLERRPAATWGNRQCVRLRKLSVIAGNLTVTRMLHTTPPPPPRRRNRGGLLWLQGDNLWK